MLCAEIERKINYMSIKTGQRAMIGPLTLVQGGVGLIIRVPIFVQNVDGNETFNMPVLSNVSCDICYNDATRTKFWGFSTVLVNTTDVQNSNRHLKGLSGRGYRYELLRNRDEISPETIISKSTKPLHDPVTATFTVPGAMVCV